MASARRKRCAMGGKAGASYRLLDTRAEVPLECKLKRISEARLGRSTEALAAFPPVPFRASGSYNRASSAVHT